MLEIVLLAAASVMIFGRNLPRTAAQLYTHFVRARRALQNVWRESGLGEEFRQVQREMEQAAETVRQQNPQVIARDMIRDVEGEVRAPLPEAGEGDPTGEDLPAEGGAEAEEGAAPDSPASGDEEAPRAKEKPPWYPENRADPFGTPKGRDE